MDQIVLKYGKILIPEALVTNTIKFKFRGLKYAGVRKGYWYVYASPANIALVKGQWGIDLQPTYDEIIAESELIFRTTPRPYQKEAVLLGHNREGFGYLLDPGLGKTKIVIDDAQSHIHAGNINQVLVICTKSMIGTWVNEIRKHGFHIPWTIERWPEGSVQDGAGPQARWLVMNIDALNFPNSYEKAFLFAISGETMMVVDESTTIKNSEAARTEAAMKIRQQCKYRRILTGTPIANTPMDLYSQLYFLDPEIVYGWSFPTFRNHFCIMGGYRNKQIIGYVNQDELSTIVASCTYKADKNKVEDLPEKIYQARYISVSDKVRQKYNEIVNQIMVQLPGINEKVTQVSVQQAITKMIKLRQIVSGFILDDHGVPVTIGNEKLKELELILDDGPGPCIVWVQFKHEIDAISKLLDEKGIKHGLIYGDIEAKYRDKAIEDFEAGDLDAMIIQNDTGSEGITLLRASTAIIYTNPLSYKTRVQLEDRCHRIGQKHSVTYIDLLVENSMDITVYHLLRHKKNLADTILLAVTERLYHRIQSILYGEGPDATN